MPLQTPAKPVVVIGENGSRQRYRSVTQVSAELQINKRDVREACRRGCKLTDCWMKFYNEPDPVGCPPTKEDEIADVLGRAKKLSQHTTGEDTKFNVTMQPNPDSEAEMQVYCTELGGGLITTIRLDNNTFNASQLCSVTCRFPCMCAPVFTLRHFCDYWLWICRQILP